MTGYDLWDWVSKLSKEELKQNIDIMITYNVGPAHTRRRKSKWASDWTPHKHINKFLFTNDSV
jgi:hypothetical protein